ncbi:DUF2958 domain-containing protein [Sphingomonas sp. AP4-R1]|uniref:DUF2958 domain-containing protein n=1 Tax=Sphingomonas sp. AP4-R1 TaxID=2735134 RepID=UPI001493A307|nr:DUF2958 domain-containing protein [Sphingomonas sp. AP4-R1]QJU60286.1 DUF2958 domain-containing protein [Sphingomonas sp. AP4-R1]
MITLPPELRAQLRTNHDARRRADVASRRFDPSPVVKFFNPLSAATWLATELDEDGDTLFGLTDFGFGCPELGSFSLSELRAIRLPYGLWIERDLGFEPLVRLSQWADTARRAGSILWAERLLRRAAQTGTDPEDPLPPGR